MGNFGAFGPNFGSTNWVLPTFQPDHQVNPKNRPSKDSKTADASKFAIIARSPPSSTGLLHALENQKNYKKICAFVMKYTCRGKHVTPCIHPLSKKGKVWKKKPLVYQKHVQLEFLLCVVTARKPWTHDLEKVSIYARMRSKGDIRTFFSQVPNKLEWGWWGHGYFFIIVIETLLFFILRCARKKFSVEKTFYWSLPFDMYFNTFTHIQIDWSPHSNLLVINVCFSEINLIWLLWFDRCDEKLFKKWWKGLPMSRM